MKAISTILYNAVPIIVMIGLIPLVTNDFTLSGIYIFIIGVSLYIKREKNDFVIFAFGFLGLLISEYFFISTGVETFNRTSLLGVMPLWLPILWGYAFIAIKRGIVALDS